MTITINTSLNVGDLVFLMKNNQIISARVSGIFVDSFHAHLLKQDIPGFQTPESIHDFPRVSYWLGGNDNNRYHGSCLFTTKEALLNTL